MQPRKVYGALKPDCTVQLSKFLEFCRVDLNHAKGTLSKNKTFLNNVFRAYGPNPSTEELRSFLGSIVNANTKDNYIKPLRICFRDFMGDSGILTLTLDKINIQVRVIYPNKESRSKRTWYSFFNT
jgi:hypothetical protein